MTARWPLPTDAPLVAAIVATRNRFWRDAIALWRDIFRHGSNDALAAGCIAEAALRIGEQGIADQMLDQFETVPDFLDRILHADGAASVEPPCGDLASFAFRPDEEIAAFRATHPLADQLPDRLNSVQQAVPLRVSPLTRLRAPKAERVAQKVAALVERRDGDALRRLATDLVERRAAPDALHWAILGIDALGVESGDTAFDALLSGFARYPLGPTPRALADARLYRGLGYPAFARLCLLEAMQQAGRARDRAKIRRRLAALAAERDRWLDDCAILSASDFGSTTPERDALLAHVRERSGPAPLQTEAVSVEPLELAFDWLLDTGLGEAEQYAPDNRLLMVGNTLGCGGMERMLARAYRHFSDGDSFERVDLALLDYADGAPSAFYADEAGVTAEDILLLGRDGDATMPFSLLPGSWKVRAQRLYAHIHDTRPRVIHAWNDLTGLLAAYAGLVAGCPKIIVHFHHTPNVPLSGRAETIASYPAVYRKLRTRLDIRTVFCAEAAARGYAQWWRVPEDERFRVLYNGFDWNIPAIGQAQAKDAIGLAGDRPVVGTVLRFSGVKQPLLWAEAAIALAKDAPDAQFLMVGDGPLRSAVADRFAEAGLAASLHMPGQVDNVPDYLAAMDLFWLTSRTEGLPNVLIEAQFSGVPIAAFDVGGIGETFVAGETGILVPPDDIAGLTHRSLALLRDQEWRDAASAKAVAQADERFSSSAFFEGLRNLY
ncbi:glycosyltransferase [Parasphingopyxis algicola]|uniref:glycosyltransferase n=1 Tax=Parasphingopyxis algicola TaxID=2026624 RepID=UPI0015A4BCAC|nr:glycosyltransferase [Parasphingopyxis algicola]QLC23988.1 glycosyltransferase [Parasphingopyxis algicola]